MAGVVARVVQVLGAAEAGSVKSEKRKVERAIRSDPEKRRNGRKGSSIKLLKLLLSWGRFLEIRLRPLVVKL
ncbi:MAG: hypothetical protein A3G34_05805 [Candidatus Lindowbacteria bacterium RIFCSPLOWO2_12_FULL_62_27]|nr:MAG: hypothetical protein A3G34_05805 [Candidatus Lindowbacteria bacterium RIFCSPLOWO2_12_FULL_62_27]OGH63721.1 MAG: hypothetical protein A3I06_09205 [Candidatus Lindowbacteria bacterium RIFCSPLOWO2_02_FULL_62_12]